MTQTSVRRPVARWHDGALTRRPDSLAVEEPLQLRVDGDDFVVTMRTPGHDVELALGYLVGEGLVRAPDDVTTARACPDAARTPADGDVPGTPNVVDVRLRAPAQAGAKARTTAITSACGVCGTRSIDDVLALLPRSGGRTKAGAPAEPRAEEGHSSCPRPTPFAATMIAGLPDALRSRQRTFDRTGGLHAAGLFDAAGRLLCVREDVGRHNAVDKVIGWAFAAGLLPLHGHALQVSGRASFELVHKAAVAGVELLAAVSAPSSLAVDLACEAGLSLVGFSRGTSFTVYSGAHRVTG